MGCRKGSIVVALALLLNVGRLNGVDAWPFEPIPPPSQPDQPPVPPTPLLPFKSGNIVNIQHKHSEMFCNISPDNVVRCNETSPASGPGEGFLVIGADYTTPDLKDGDTVSFKSQKANMLCSVGPDDGLLACKDMFQEQNGGSFVVNLDGPNAEVVVKPLNGTYCYPSHKHHGPEADHAIVCKGQPHHKVFIIRPYDFMPTPPPAPEPAGEGGDNQHLNVAADTQEKQGSSATSSA